GVGAHRMTDDVRLLYAEAIQEGDDVAASDVLPVARRIARHLRGWITARREGDAAMSAREMAQLRLPGPIVAGELVNEDNRRSAACFFVIELCAVRTRDCGHRRRLSFSGLPRPARSGQTADSAWRRPKANGPPSRAARPSPHSRCFRSARTTSSA